jgi:hypothetical protein
MTFLSVAFQEADLPGWRLLKNESLLLKLSISNKFQLIPGLNVSWVSGILS